MLNLEGFGSFCMAGLQKLTHGWNGPAMTSVPVLPCPLGIH
jgi:hypothetical protein